ncbi:MAG: hypothetical protein HYX52_06820 [Chloroflexi bacterium]|nr:hypothetical protein [Chloroflexota bacterium]
MAAEREWGAASLLGLIVAGVLIEVAWLAFWPIGLAFTRTPDVSRMALSSPLVGSFTSALQGALAPLLPGISLTQPSPPLLAALGLTFAIAGAAYLAGVTLLARTAGAWRWALPFVVAVTVASQVTLLFAPAVLTTDVFSYLLYGRAVAVYGVDPYLAPPAQFLGDPFLPWIHPLWYGATTVYGPLWTRLSAFFAGLSAPLAPFQQWLLLRALVNVSYGVLLWLAWWILGPDQAGGERGRASRVASFALLAWNPLLQFEVGAGAHNDILMALLLLASLAPIAAWRRGVAADRSWLASFLLLTASGLVKYATAIAAPFLVVVWVRTTRGRWRAGRLLVAAALGGGLALAAGAPWLPGALLPRSAGTLYTNAPWYVVWYWVAQGPGVLVDGVSNLGPDPTDGGRSLVRLALALLFAVYLAWETWRVWRAPGPPVLAIARATTRAFLVLILGVLNGVQAWYWMWALVPAALLGWRDPLARLVVAYSVAAAMTFNVHDYWYVVFSREMPGWLTLAYAVLPPLATALTLIRRAPVGQPPGQVAAARRGAGQSLQATPP